MASLFGCYVEAALLYRFFPQLWLLPPVDPARQGSTRFGQDEYTHTDTQTHRHTQTHTDTHTPPVHMNKTTYICKTHKYTQSQKHTYVDTQKRKKIRRAHV